MGKEIIERRCDKCEFSEFTNEGLFGICRRCAPRAVSIAHRKFEEYVCKRNEIEDYTGSIWPLVRVDDWCGEFKKQ